MAHRAQIILSFLASRFGFDFTQRKKAALRMPTGAAQYGS
jgi:hypothetical protein